MRAMEKRRNVYEAALSRIEKIFSDFDNIYVSFSGGKDSGVLLNPLTDYIRRHKLKRRIGVFHMDYEVQYSATLQYVEKVFSENTDILDIYRVCVPFKVSTCTSMHQSYWRPWDEEMKEIWVREMPRSAFRKEDFDFFSDDLWDYDFQMRFAEWLHRYKRPHAPAACRYPHPGELQPLAGHTQRQKLLLLRALQVDTQNCRRRVQRPTPSTTGARPTCGWPTAASAGPTTTSTTSTTRPVSLSKNNGWPAPSSRRPFPACNSTGPSTPKCGAA